MSVSLLTQFSALTESVFRHSPQAVLAISDTKVTYANRAAIDLLGINPTGLPHINYVDAAFATLLSNRQSHEIPKTRRVKFFDHYYDILPLLCHETLLLFLYPPHAIYDKADLLRDTVLLSKALCKTATQAFDDNDPKTLKATLFQSNLAIETLEYACNASLSGYDFISLFEYAMSSFSDLSEREFLTMSITRGNTTPIVALDNRLMHAALVGTIFDLLRLSADHDVLSVSCTNSKTEVTLTFSCEHTKFPKELETLLFGEAKDLAVELLQKHGTSLFLSKRIFALHNAKFQIENSNTGFKLALSFPCAIQPPKLYMGGTLRTNFPTPFSLPRETIHAFFLNSEKA